MGGGMGGLLNGANVNAEVEAKLKQNAGDYTWVAAAIGSQNAASYQLATEKPVMAIGGFNGSDPSPTLAQFKQYVADGKIHYFISGGGRAAARAAAATPAPEITTWVEATFTKVTVDGTTLYDLTGRDEEVDAAGHPPAVRMAYSAIPCTVYGDSPVHRTREPRMTATTAETDTAPTGRPSAALADPRRHLPRPAHRAARQHRPQRRDPLPHPGAGRLHRRHPVDDQRLLAGPVRAAAHRGQRRRPLRPQEDAGRGLALFGIGSLAAGLAQSPAS